MYFCVIKVAGTWSLWTEWTSCDTGNSSFYGTRKRTRSCKGPFYDGQPCQGDETSQVQNCTHGGWSEWTNVTQCSTTCGDSSVILFERSCNEPLPSNGGWNCEGDATKVENCTEFMGFPCPSKFTFLKCHILVPFKKHSLT